MNDELQKALAEIIASLTQAANQVGVEAHEQLPLLVQEYLAFGKAQSLFIITIGVACFVAAVWLQQSMRRRYRNRSRPDQYSIDQVDYVMLSVVLPGILAAGSILAIIVNAFILLKISVAPRVYLLERVSELVR